MSCWLALEQLQPLHVDLIEQPVAAGADQGLDGYADARSRSVPTSRCPRKTICRDWSDRYQFVNIKLDKVGGLTAGLELATAARTAGFRLMVGCMLGGSISVAPGMVLAQQCEVCDLDGPWLQAEDWPSGHRLSPGTHVHTYAGVVGMRRGSATPLAVAMRRFSRGLRELARVVRFRRRYNESRCEGNPW